MTFNYATYIFQATVVTSIDASVDVTIDAYIWFLALDSWPLTLFSNFDFLVKTSNQLTRKLAN